jgi:NAD(P)H-dependent flavin oxidoreductase YrpB (nitropropane dioxygenase family)
MQLPLTKLRNAPCCYCAGIRAIVVQGSKACGHRGTWYESGDYCPHMTGTTMLESSLVMLRVSPLQASVPLWFRVQKQGATGAHGMKAVITAPT